MGHILTCPSRSCVVSLLKMFVFPLFLEVTRLFFTLLLGSGQSPLASRKEALFFHSRVSGLGVSS